MSFLIIFVIVIIILQFFLFIKTARLITRLKKVLSGVFSTGTTIAEDITVIKYNPGNKGVDKVTENIGTSINTYLRKNKGAVSDFNLIKDIVERNCDSLESEISSQTPLPLYLGLMGTVAGIILGLFTITVNGGFAQIDKVIEILMSDVAIAMVASFMGIGFTTLSLWKSKQCKVTVEANKNKFYTWIQTNLLPVISKSAVSAITLLQKNLTRFNESFTGTVERLEDKLGDVGDLYSAQIEILEKIEAIDVKKMAVANVKVLSALNGSMGSLDRFSQYMGSVTEYLTAVKELNDKLDEHLERTETLGVVSDFYKSQIKEIGLRQDAIKSAVLSVDDVMKSALASLKANGETGLKSMQEAFTQQIMSMQQMVGKQTKQLMIQMNQMPQLLQRMDEISAIPSKIDSLLDRIEKSNTNLIRKMSIEIIHSMSSIRTRPEAKDSSFSSNKKDDNIDRGDTKQNILTKWIMLGILWIIAIVLVANLTVNILSYRSQKVAIPQNIEVPIEHTHDPLREFVDSDEDSPSVMMQKADEVVKTPKVEYSPEKETSSLKYNEAQSITEKSEIVINQKK